jgi:hypothetical protein
MPGALIWRAPGILLYIQVISQIRSMRPDLGGALAVLDVDDGVGHGLGHLDREERADEIADRGKSDGHLGP